MPVGSPLFMTGRFIARPAPLRQIMGLATPLRHLRPGAGTR
jgi:hypothetical protein